MAHPITKSLIRATPSLPAIMLATAKGRLRRLKDLAAQPRFPSDVDRGAVKDVAEQMTEGIHQMSQAKGAADATGDANRRAEANATVCETMSQMIEQLDALISRIEALR